MSSVSTPAADTSPSVEKEKNTIFPDDEHMPECIDSYSAGKNR